MLLAGCDSIDALVGFHNIHNNKPFCNIYTVEFC